MNFITIIILAAIVVDFILSGLADILNLRSLKTEFPESFKGYYDADSYRKSQEYLRVNTKFGWITSSFNMLLILIFWFGKGFPVIDQWVRSWNFNYIITGLLYIGLLLLFKAILSLPFSIYSTFVIEERFGFNKTKWSTFIMDIVKGFLLSVLLGAPLLAGILAFFEYAGANAWLYCWIAVTIFMLVIQFIAPTWIMPLFNKFNPLEDGDLKDAIMSYARSIKFSLENVFVMDGSKRSAKSNAFFTGFGKHKRIVLFDTLINQHTVNELVAVLAHEMGHYKKKHILQRILIGVIQMGIMFFLLSVFVSYQGLFDAFYMEHKSVYAGLIFFSMLYSPIDFFIGIFIQMLSRKNEYDADNFAVETTKNPLSLVNALKKLSVHNLSNLLPHPFYVFLNYSHPPVLERVKAIKGEGLRLKAEG
ncbi:MAG: M48 family metallopeptidase [Desulfobacteraceae bacterium]|nr:M48 family metallopeptidase [Pseudomonadota bacterium]MBU4257762.1 M48 family metallopeptidase [Pseudomonadota bacterium]MCG2758563.1 M48 family metallopeptidase [Desulfobacteraceae bacterium]